MTNEELYQHLAKVTAKALIVTGVEGAYDSVAKSTAYDYPSIGCSQWEGSRADRLLSMIPGGYIYTGRSYYDLMNSSSLEELKSLLRSKEGIEVQTCMLAEDTIQYIQTLAPLFLDSKCLVYAATWAPTSLSTVRIFCQNRVLWGYNVNDLGTLRSLFRDQYYRAADVGDAYRVGYANRANTMYTYLLDLNIWGLS